MRKLMLVFLLTCVSGNVQAAEEVQGLCGPPPVVSDEVWQAEVEGEAHLLSKRLIGGEGKARLKEWQTDIFSKYPDADRARVNAYMQYSVCAAILETEDISPAEKVELLLRVYEALQTGGLNQPAVSGTVGDVADSARVFQNNLSISIVEREANLSTGQKELLQQITSVVNAAVSAANSDRVDQHSTDQIAQALSDIAKEVPINDYMVRLDTFEILKDRAFFLKGTETVLSVRAIEQGRVLAHLSNKPTYIRIGDIVEIKGTSNSCRLILHEIKVKDERAVFSYLCTR